MRKLWIPRRLIRPVFKLEACERCDRVELLVCTPSMTAYVDDSLNKDKWLCPLCSQDYIAHMESQWADYYSGLL